MFWMSCRVASISSCSNLFFSLSPARSSCARHRVFFLIIDIEMIEFKQIVSLKKMTVIYHVYVFFFLVIYAPSSLSTSFWSFCTDLSANSARASACKNAIFY
ncbi:hypothetical protein PUN28_002688 [Cardiocondyla obscurior]|uniref:Secreted protein n=1 Tax=Cardiocondyla obscurior TaxID=286306 RepID=A0AAW2GVJ4_9HYME